jgi:DNA repair exonuclease SbcCD ATPase subunit
MHPDDTTRQEHKRAQWREATQRYRQNHPPTEEQKQHRRATNRARYTDKREYVRTQQGEYYQATLEQRRAYHKSYNQTNKSVYQGSQRQYRNRLRAEMLAAYGGACVCCGESTPVFLALDHINGDGHTERKTIKGNVALFLKLKAEGWPRDRHRILCHNCNTAMAILNYCPHQPPISPPTLG